MVQKIESDGTAERIAGLKGPDRSQEPTAAAPEYPGSQQDRERNKFRPSFWKRLTQVAVSNDDGSPIIGDLEAKMENLLAELNLLRETVTTIGNRENGQLVQIEQANQALPVQSSVAVLPLLIVPGIGAAAAYAAEDQMGTVLKFEAPSRGVIREVKFYDLDDEGIDKEIWLFNANPTLATDNDAFSIAKADAQNVIAVFAITTWRDGVNCQVGFTLNTPASYDLQGRETIYAAVKTKGVDNIAAGSEPRISLVIERYA